MKLREALGDLPETVFADLLESDDAYLLVIDLPGATDDTVNVTVEDGRLGIDARRAKSIPAGFEYVSEERSVFLDAELPLPPDATGADADGTISKGVLTLELPKSDEASRRLIPIT